MKLSELIKQLQEIEKEHGDIEARLFSDASFNYERIKIVSVKRLIIGGENKEVVIIMN